MTLRAMAEDSCSHRPERRVDKPWGHEIWFAVTERYAGKVLHINEGESLSLQYHEHKDEAIIVISGELELQLGDAAGKVSSHLLGPGDCQRIVPHQLHRMVARTNVDVCEVSTPDLDDVVRVEDRYGRASPDNAGGSRGE